MEREYFTKSEADSLVGRRIQTLVEFSGVPKGVAGVVLRADSAGRTKGVGAKAPDEVYNLAIQWELPAEKAAVATGEAAGEPFLVIRRGGPLVDWFSKDEYQKYLREL